MNRQEALWAGSFGDDYTERNRRTLDNDRVLFARVLTSCIRFWSVIEFGAGEGANLAAIKLVDAEFETTGIEINQKAFAKLKDVADFAVNASMLNFSPDRQWSLAFTKGLLIHIAPADLDDAYEVLYRSAATYIMLAEYYSPKPVEIPYRGQQAALWKRDFAGEMMDKYPDLQLVDYGFIYHRSAFPQDDLTWFLMEKR